MSDKNRSTSKGEILRLRVSEDFKKAVEQTADEQGLQLSSLTRLALHQYMKRAKADQG